MKKRSLAKLFGTYLLAGAMGFFPVKKAVALEDMVNGTVIETISEEKVKDGVEIKAWEYLGDGIGDFVGETVTSDGGFELELDNNSSNYLMLEISHPDSSYYQAVRYVNVNDEINLDVVERHDVDVSYDIDILDKTMKMDEMDFMQFFNEWCRAPPVGGIPTHRWTEQPKWYIYTGTEYTNGVEITQDKIDLVKDMINNYLIQFSNGFINNPIIKEREEMPENFPYSPGNIIVFWRDNGGAGVHGEELDGNEIYSGVVAFNLNDPNIIRVAYTEELTQVLGPTSEVETRYFYDENGEMLESGYELGKFLYSRPIGNKTPDVDPMPEVEIIRYVRPVTNLTIEDVPDDEGNQLELNWNASVSEGKNLVSKYRIYRSENSDINNVALIDSIGVGKTSFIDRVPQNNTLYYYWVETVGNVDNYQVEKAANSEGETRYIEAPFNLKVEDVPNDNGHQLKLNWELSPSENENAVDFYRIYRSRNSELGEIKPLSELETLDEINGWDEYNTVLVDSVFAGNNNFTDRAVPINGVPYFYWVEAVGYDGELSSNKIAGTYNGEPLEVEADNPSKFKVSNAYPNPFNSSTTIEYTLPDKSNVELVVYDISGRKVRVLEDSYKEKGSYNANWDGRDNNGNNVGNGVYLFRLNAGEYNKSGKMSLVK